MNTEFDALTAVQEADRRYCEWQEAKRKAAETYSLDDAIRARQCRWAYQEAKDRAERLTLSFGVAPVRTVSRLADQVTMVALDGEDRRR